MNSKIRKAFDKAYAMFLDMALILPGVQANPPRKQVVTHEHHVHVEAGKDAGENFADELRRQQAAQTYTETTR